MKKSLLVFFIGVIIAVIGIAGNIYWILQPFQAYTLIVNTWVCDRDAYLAVGIIGFVITCLSGYRYIKETW